MKIVLSILITFLFIFSAVMHADAATPTPTKAAVTPTTTKTTPASGEVNEKLDQQINQLKEKIASRVSELNLVEKQGMIGVVSEVSANQITLTDLTGKKRFVDVDEITKFSSTGSKGTFGLSDLVKGTKVSILGLYNKQSKRILARFIETTVTPTYLSGTIAAIDKKNDIVTVQTDEQKQIKIDVGTTTKISQYTKGEDIAKYGFSKLAVGDRVTGVGYTSKKDSSLIVGDRLLVLSDLPKNPKIVVKSPEELVTPTTAQLAPTKSTKK